MRVFIWVGDKKICQKILLSYGQKSHTIGLYKLVLCLDCIMVRFNWQEKTFEMAKMAKLSFICDKCC